MKKLLLTFMLFSIVTIGFGQTTYYWVGGTTGSLSSTSSWNTQLDGGGTAIPTSPTASANPSSTDVLVFDGTNIGGTTPTTGQVIPSITTSFAMGQLKFQNNADVVFMRSPSSTSAGSGTSNITINGDGSSAHDLTIDGASSFKITTPTGYTNAQSLAVIISSTATAQINGTFIINDGGRGKNYISAANPSSVFFANGSKCYVNNTFTSSYPLSSSGSGTINGGIIFQSGSSLIYQGGNSPYTTTSAAIPMTFDSGSNFILESDITGTNTFKSHYFSNINIRNNATVNVDSPPYHIDNLTIESGAALNLTTTGTYPIAGDVTIDGTLSSAAGYTSTQIVMIGTSPQTFGGTGTFNGVSAFTVGTDASVTLNKDVIIGSDATASTSSISGTLIAQNNSISSAGKTTAGNINIREASSVTSNNAATVSLSTPNVVTLTDATTYNNANVSVGNKVVGTNIPANTYIIATNSGSNQFTISNPVSTAITNGTITISNTSATISTSNAGGIDATISTAGSRVFGSGTNLVFNAATTAPFPTFSTNNIGKLTVSAAITTNRDATVDGELALDNAKLTVREGDTFTISSTGIISGYSSNAYVVTSANTGTGATGNLSILGITSSKFIPVGSASNYLAIILNPSASSDFSINVFQGATTDATPNGTALSAGQKADLVDAIYNINRTSGSGNVDVTLGWQAGLEGSNFSGFSDAQVGVAQYSGSYGSFVGPGNNASNTITTTVSSFAPFLIGKVGTLPVKLISFTAKGVNQTSVLNWQSTSEVNLSNFVIQRSTDGQSFSDIGSVAAHNAAGIFNYSFVDQSPNFGTNYYRLLSIDLDGSKSTSDTRAVSFGSLGALSVYPNPAKTNVNLSGLRKGDIIKVTDLEGREIKSQVYQGENVMNLDVSNLNVGIYLLSVSREGKITDTARLIKD